MDISRWKALNPYRSLFGVVVILTLALAAKPAAGAPDDAERDMHGFDTTMVRQEKALRALNKGETYLKDGLLDKAREYFNEALALNPDLNEARFSLGLTEFEGEKYKLAIAHFKGVYERDPRFRNLRLELARTFLASGDCEQAGVWLKRHLEINKADKDTKKLKRQIDECSNRRGN